MNKKQTLRLTVMAAALLAGLSASAADVVISQVYGGGSNSGAPLNADFIELFNRGSSPVSLNGWAVQYASSAGSSWTNRTNISGVTLQPGQYYLIKGAGGMIGAELPATPDLIGTINLSGSAGKIALTNTQTALTGTSPTGGALVDLIGWGNGTNGFEGAAAAATGNATAVLRNNGGCADTDNNFNDTTIAAPAPRNSASPFNVCSTGPVVKNIVPVCPASVAVAQGFAQVVALAASDEDGIVNAANITSASVAGISLTGFNAASTEGGSATATLSIAGNVAAGSYPVAIQWNNNQSQPVSCTVNVTVSGLAAVTHTIPQIQGAGATSPFANTTQTTEGTVTAKVANGFFLQDPQGDGDPTTSDAVFVFMGNTPFNVTIGDKVRVTATVSEFTPSGANRSYTELINASAIVSQGVGASVTPANITLGDKLANVEAMLVRFTQPLVINHSEYLGNRGELELGSYRHEQPTNRFPARSDQANQLNAAQVADTIVMDDGIFVTPTVIPYIGQDGTVRVGDTVHGLTGVIDFGSVGGGGAGFKLQPTVTPQFSRDNPRTDAPQVPAGNVRVASANVLNFFTTFTNGNDIFGNTNQGCALGGSTSKSNCRGADNLTEFQRQRDKIVAELKAMDADVVGLMEIQNNGDTAVTYLVDQLNGVTAPGTYAVVPKPAATGTDAIRVAMIYKPAKVALAGASLSDADAINNRPPFAQTFRANNGEKFSVIVNHLKSKGSCPSGSGVDADKGDYQGCWNGTRIQQAQRLVGSFVPQVQAAAGDPDVLLIGDMNSYGMEDPVVAMTSAGFVNQLERFVRPNGIPHSYVFDGLSGYLDHALASASLSPQVAGVTEWNVNADEPVVIDYNTDGKPQDLYTALPYRASDHDPVVISLNLQPAVQDVTGGVKSVASGFVLNRITNKFTGTVQLTNTSGATLNGPLQLEFQSLSSGVSLANGSGAHNGNGFITLPQGLAAGASVSVPVQFNNPSKGAISFTLKVFSGNF
jgi:predicted extracellular nuclease